MGTDDAETLLSNVPIKTRRNNLMMTIMSARLTFPNGSSNDKCVSMLLVP